MTISACCSTPRFRLPAGLVQAIDRAQRRFLDCPRSGASPRASAVAASSTAMATCGRSTSASATASTSSTASNSTTGCASSIRSTRSPFCRWNASGSAPPGPAIICGAGMKVLLRDGPADELFAFYRCHRATLRARLAIAHLYEEHPRTPEKWPRLCRAYLGIAARERAPVGADAQTTIRSVSVTVFMQAADAGRDKRRGGQHGELAHRRGAGEAEGRHAVGDDQPVDRRDRPASRPSPP